MGAVDERRISIAASQAGHTRARPVLVHIMTDPAALGFLTGQVEYMKTHGFDVAAVSSPGDELDAFAHTHAVPVHAISMARRITPVRDLVALGRLYRYLRRTRPQIVHAHTPKGGLLGTIAAWLARVPVRMYHMRGLPYMTASGARRTLLRWTEIVSCALAHRVVCVSTSLRDVAVRDGLCQPAKMTVLAGGSGNGVDARQRFNPDRWHPSRDATRRKYEIPRAATVVGFVGRIVRDKGVAELVEAWLALREEFSTLHLLMVGPFEPQDPVPTAVERVLRCDPRIHLTGNLRDAAAVYAAMDLVVLPTYREGFPNVPLEASAMRLPVIATRIPGCVDAIDDAVTGMLVAPRDARAVRDAIRMYLHDPGLRCRQGKAGRERVLRHFQPEAVWKALHLEYTGLLRRSAAGDRTVKNFVLSTFRASSPVHRSHLSE
jgi:glycosyltransferase involved in cell wall biosynthesis